EVSLSRAYMCSTPRRDHVHASEGAHAWLFQGSVIQKIGASQFSVDFVERSAQLRRVPHHEVFAPGRLGQTAQHSIACGSLLGTMRRDRIDDDARAFGAGNGLV